jgi:hypothetical protein
LNNPAGYLKRALQRNIKFCKFLRNSQRCPIQRDFFSFSVPEYEVVQIHSVRHSKRSSPDDVIHRVSLDTHGRNLQLELSQNRHLLRRDRPLELWYADQPESEHANVTYVPGPEVRQNNTGLTLRPAMDGHKHPNIQNFKNIGILYQT